MTNKHSTNFGISTAAKNLACFILAASAKNSTLAADAAFRAHRYDADPKQLVACNETYYLHAIYATIAQRQLSLSAETTFRPRCPVRSRRL